MTFKEPSKNVTAKICPRCSREFSASGNLNVCPHDQSLLSLVTADPFIGTTIANHYLVTDVLGQGGWSVVYRAQHETIKNRLVAIKILHSHLVRDKDKVLRFQREAEAAMSLTHPQVAAVYDYGVLAEGQPFIVMEYLEGVALSELLAEQGPLPVERALAIGKQACVGLAAAHGRGVIHRDVKPSNIFITKDASGQDLVKILDFGLAKILDTGESGTLTLTGETMGTPDYMSPEQCLGMNLDARTDLYTLGYVLYEAVTGKQAVSGKNTYESMNLHIYQMPAPFAVANPNVLVPDSFEAVVFKALAKNPDDRYQTALEMKDALERASQQKEQTLSAFRKLLGSMKRRQSQNQQYGPAHRAKKRPDALTIAVPLLAVLVLAGAVAFKVYEFRAGSGPVAQTTPLDAWKSANTAGINAYNEADYKKAVQFFEKAESYGAQIGEDSEQHKISLNYLKDSYAKFGNTEMAQKAERKIKAIEDSNYYKEYGTREANDKKIRQLFRELLAQPNDKHIAVNLAETLNNQTTLSIYEAKYDEARELMDQAIDIETRMLGKNHPEYAKSISNKAAILVNSGKLDEAGPLYEEALAIRENALGPNAALVARSLRNLADYYRRTGKDREALPLIKRAMSIYEKTNGPESNDYLWCVNNLGITYTAVGDYPEAERWLKQVLAARAKMDGTQHIDYGRALCNLGQLNCLRGNFVDAEKQISEAMNIFENKLGPTKSEYGLGALNLGEVYLRSDRFPLAEKYLRRALSVLRTTEPASDHTVAAFQKLIDVLRKQNKIEEAQTLTREMND